MAPHHLTTLNKRRRNVARTSPTGAYPTRPTTVPKKRASEARVTREESDGFQVWHGLAQKMRK